MADGCCLLLSYSYKVVQKLLIGDGLSGGEVISLRRKLHISHLDDLDDLLRHADAINEAELGPFIVGSDGQGVFIGLYYPFEGAP